MKPVPTDQFNQKEVTTDPTLEWEHLPKPFLGQVENIISREVDEVHQYDAPYGGAAGLGMGPTNATGINRKNAK